MKVYMKPILKKLEDLIIDVLGFPYKIKFVDKLIERFQVCGCASVWGDEIQLDPSVTTLDLFASIFHEIFELMLRKTETKCEHELISRFEIFLMMILINNTELMELALETAKKEGKSLKNRRAKSLKELVKSCKGKSKK